MAVVIDSERPSSTLAKKLAKILGDINKVEKSGTNTFHKYNYVTESALVNEVRTKLSAVGVFVFTSVEEQKIEVFTDEATKKQTALTTVSLKHTFMDGETGESFTVLSKGQGCDNGDKGGYKAITGAMKYFIYKNFMVPTEDDPENPTKAEKKAAKEQGGLGTVQKRETISQSGGVETGVATRMSGPTDWRKCPVPKFITKYAGRTLGDMAVENEDDLIYWVKNFKPKPYNGKIQAGDRDLRDALDQADIEFFGR